MPQCMRVQGHGIHSLAGRSGWNGVRGGATGAGGECRPAGRRPCSAKFANRAARQDRSGGKAAEGEPGGARGARPPPQPPVPGALRGTAGADGADLTASLPARRRTPR